ncbi:MAG: hypothetical protein ACUVQ6_06055 [Dissulfurimicrobium sp.]|uniref:hypothetical protein n=1 Tax=Dissulfurimicrobium sp. TaxID=2022436 RepID=UPI0040493186
MNQGMEFLVRPIGIVESLLESRQDAPKQGNKGAPEAWLVIDKGLPRALMAFWLARRYSSSHGFIWPKGMCSRCIHGGMTATP